MTDLEWTLIVVYGMVLALWVVRHVLIGIVRPKLHCLTRQSPRFLGRDAAGHVPASPPLVSVMIPAKDEERAIGGCIESVLAQTYPNLEVIVIDDRSGDRTAEIVQAITARDRRVRLIRNTELPPGWTGKTYVLHRGSAEARGDWLLFIDADTQHEPENLDVMLEYARHHDADLVSLLPRMRNESFWERVIQPLAGIILMLFYNLPRVNDPKHPRAAFANGQYILVRRSAYDAIGGHESVRDQFVEDIHLGRRAKRMGHTIRVAMAGDLSSCRMYTSLHEIVRGWSRILYAAVDHRPAKLIGVMATMLILSISAYLVPIAIVVLIVKRGLTPFMLTLMVMNAAHLVLLFTAYWRMYGFARNDRRYVLLSPLANLAMLWVLGRAIGMCYSHRVTWRGTEYVRLSGSSSTAPAAEQGVSKT